MASYEELEFLVLRAMACSARVPVCPVDAIIRSWDRMFGDRDAALLGLALDHIFARDDRWPTPVRILAEISAIEDALGGRRRPSAEEAWEEVVSQMRRVGRYGSPTWSCEAVGRAAMALYGSWEALCERTTEQLAYDRAHFLRFYATFADEVEQEPGTHGALPPADGETRALEAGG